MAVSNPNGPYANSIALKFIWKFNRICHIAQCLCKTLQVASDVMLFHLLNFRRFHDHEIVQYNHLFMGSNQKQINWTNSNLNILLTGQQLNIPRD